MTLHNPDDDDHARRNPDEESDADADANSLGAITYEHREDAVEGVTIFNPEAVGEDGGEWITARSIACDRDQIV